MKHSLSFIIILFSMTTACFGQKGKGVTPEESTRMTLDTLGVNMDARFALVIGNANYKGSTLKNPVNDAMGITELLKKYGFKVTVKTDLSEKEMDKAIEEFGNMVSSNRGIGLFYYSGHGMQHNSQNYLLPLKSKLVKEDDIELQSVKLNKVLEKISYSRKGLNIVILDACRTSPFYTALKNIPRGLTYSLKAAKNTLIFFATSANEVAEDGEGKNSPFTEAFISVINKSDSIELMQITKQVTREVGDKTLDRQIPQSVGTTTSDFYFRKIAQPPHKIFILSIGINNYQDASYELQSARNGARDFREAFLANPSLSYINRAWTAYALLDNAATNMNILSTIHKIKTEALPGDLIVVYFNGHMGSDGSGFYFMPYNADFKNPLASAIGSEKLLSILADLPCKSLLFLDGAAAEAAGDNSLLVNTLLTPRNNVVVFSASGKDGKYLDSIVNGGSLFSTAIRMGLNEAASTENPGFIDVESLSNFVIRKVKELSNNRQVPATYYPRAWQNFILAKTQANK